MTRENHGPSELIAYRYNPTRLVNGLQDETCRHLNDMAMGMSAMLNAVETARMQGSNSPGYVGVST